MFTVNLSKDNDYSTQLGNLLIPYDACNVTAGIMWLLAGKVVWWFPQAMKPQDYLTAILLGDDAWKRFVTNEREKYKAGLLPQNVSSMLAWGINRMVGFEIDWFIQNGTLQQMIWFLYKGSPLIMSGPFTKAGHFVCVVGFTSLQHEGDWHSEKDINMDLVDIIWVDDPYGNYHTGYKDRNGNNVGFNLADFDKLTNIPNGQKWMHVNREKIK